MKRKQILAITAVVLLVSLYVITFILAFCSFPGSDRLLTGFLMLDIAVPILAWILLYTYKHFGIQEKDEDERKKMS